MYGISKTYCLQAGQQTVFGMDTGFNRKEEMASHTRGVVPILSQETPRALIGWKPYGPKTIKVAFKTKKEGITMNHRITLGQGPDHLVVGLNAKIGMDNTVYKDIMG